MIGEIIGRQFGDMKASQDKQLQDKQVRDPQDQDQRGAQKIPLLAETSVETEDLITVSVQVSLKEWAIYKSAAELSHEIGLIPSRTLTALLARAAVHHFPSPGAMGTRLAAPSFHPGPEVLGKKRSFLNEEIKSMAIRQTREVSNRLRFYALFFRVPLKNVILTALLKETIRVMDIMPSTKTGRRQIIEDLRSVLSDHIQVSPETRKHENVFIPNDLHELHFKPRGRVSQYLDELLPPAEMLLPVLNSRGTQLVAPPMTQELIDWLWNIGRSVVVAPTYPPEDLMRVRFRPHPDTLPQRIDIAAAYLTLPRAEMLTSLIGGSIRRFGKPF